MVSEEAAAREARIKEERARLERHGYEMVRKPSEKVFWKDPGSDNLLPQSVAMDSVKSSEEEKLEAAGWRPVKENRYWRNPESGRLYPRSAAYDFLKTLEDPPDDD